MKTILTSACLFTVLSTFGQSKISTDDLKIIIGSWEGTITYLDYQTNKPFTMTANLIVEEGRNENTLVLQNIYPSEPKANNSEKIKISKNGSLLNKHAVTKRTEFENGQVQIQTEYNGKDDNKKALIRYTYIMSYDHFNIKKEVQFDQGDPWIRRSEFNYTRNK